MISLSGVVWIIVYLCIAAAVFALLWMFIDQVAKLFSGEAAALFVKVARVVLMLLAILLLIGFLISFLGGQQLFRP